jgi:hypothetical protein
MPEIEYRDLDLQGAQKWLQLNDRNIDIDASGYDGTLRVYNTFFEVTYLPVTFLIGEQVSAFLQGVDDSNNGAGALIENPALVIEAILKTFLGFTDGEVDAPSFAAVTAELSDVDFGFSLRDRKDSSQLLSELAFQARCYLFAEGTSYKIVRRPSIYGATDRAISDTGVTGFFPGSTKLMPMGTDNIYNRIVIEYSEDYNRDSNPFRYIATAEDTISQATYGVKELIVQAWAIRNRREAQSLADYQLAQMKDPRYFYSFRSSLPANYDVERGDILTITDSKWNLLSAKGLVVAISFQAGDTNDRTPFTMEITVLLEPYRWTWTESGDLQWSPGQAGLLFTGAAGILATQAAGGDLVPTMRFTASDTSSTPEGATTAVSTPRVLITGRIRMRESLANAAENPISWDDTNKRILFALDDNTTLMALEAGTGDLLVAERTIDRQTLAFAGAVNEINSDASNIWFNADSVRTIETDDTGWASIADVIIENVPDTDIL